MTQVKVCGLACAEDVRLAAQLGAWALGFVLTESPRRVTVARAAELVAAARMARTPSGAAQGVVAARTPSDAAEHRPGVVGADTGGRPAADGPLTIAVVTTESADWIAAAVARTNVDGVQLSAGADGPSVADVWAATTRAGRRALVIAAADTPDARVADFILLDARTADAYGGTGETLDWQALAADPATPSAGLVLAGGLRPENVGEAIAAVRPFAVDVSGGVELAPGRKDHQRLHDFFAAVEHASRGGATSGSQRPSASGSQQGGATPRATLRRTIG